MAFAALAVAGGSGTGPRGNAASGNRVPIVAASQTGPGVGLSAMARNVFRQQCLCEDKMTALGNAVQRSECLSN